MNDAPKKIELIYEDNLRFRYFDKINFDCGVAAFGVFFLYEPPLHPTIPPPETKRGLGPVTQTMPEIDAANANPLRIAYKNDINYRSLARVMFVNKFNHTLWKHKQQLCIIRSYFH